MSELMTIDEAAAFLTMSKATVYRLLYAREWDDKIARGEKTLDDVPRDVKSCLGQNFPPRVYLGQRITRLRKSEVVAWLERRFAREPAVS